MTVDKKYKEYSTGKVENYKKIWEEDFFTSVSLVDVGEIIFIIIGFFIFLCLSLGLKLAFLVILILFYWFKIKLIEKKIIKAKQYLVLGTKFIHESFRGGGVTEEGAKPHYNSHKRGFDDYIDFLETQRNHLVARMIILNLFALVMLEITKQISQVIK